jgi:hypothetical protein
MLPKHFRIGTLVRSIFSGSDIPIWDNWDSEEKVSTGNLKRNEIAIIITGPTAYGNEPHLRKSWSEGYAVKIVSLSLSRGWVNINLIDEL